MSTRAQDYFMALSRRRRRGPRGGAAIINWMAMQDGNRVADLLSGIEDEINVVV